MTLTVVTVVLLGGVNIFGGPGHDPGRRARRARRRGHAERASARQRVGRGPEHRPRAAADPLGRHPHLCSPGQVGHRPSRAGVGRRRPARSQVVSKRSSKQWRRNALKHTARRAIRRPHRGRGHRALGLLDRASHGGSVGRRTVGCPVGGGAVEPARRHRRPRPPRPASRSPSATCRRTSSTSTSPPPRPASTRPPASSVAPSPRSARTRRRPTSRSRSSPTSRPRASTRSSSRPTARTRSPRPSRRRWTRASRSSASTRARPSAPTTCSSTRSTSAASATASSSGPARSSRTAPASSRSCRPRRRRPTRTRGSTA